MDTSKPLGLALQKFQEFLPAIEQASHCYVAYSGGKDSHVLLHLLARFIPKQRITAIHINHQLSVNADAWADHCEKVCQQLGVNCVVEAVTVDKTKLGLEAGARKARYSVFKRYVKASDILLMAHHGDDQIETLFYRLLRGSGLDGLRGIPVSRNLGQGQLLRPLLKASQKDIDDYASLLNLLWVEDESNQNSNFDRNYIRQQLIPQLSKRWPNYQQRMETSVDHINDAYLLNQQLAEIDFAQLTFKKERQGNSVEILGLAQLSLLRQKNVLRFWFKTLGLTPPNETLLQSIFNDLVAAKGDANPIVNCSDAVVRRFNGKVYVIASDKVCDQDQSHLVEGVGQYPVKEGFKLQVEEAQGCGLAFTKDAQILIKYRQGGERCRPAGRSGSAGLKQLFQEYQLEPWLRPVVPLIYVNDQLAAVGDLWVCEDFAASGKQHGLIFNWCSPVNNID